VGRIIRVRLSVVPILDKFRILTELDNPDLEDEFNNLDADGLQELTDHQQRARANRERHNTREPVEAGFINASNYEREPSYAHAGIHLRGRQEDEIAWFSNQRINFIIEVGPDPQLFRLRQALGPDDHLVTKADLHDLQYFPFVNAGPFPLICRSGREVRSGPLLRDGGGRLHPVVRDQRYYKFSVTVLGTDITLDPHIEGHDS